MRVLGFIPARGGSKGIHRKNLQILKGKTLVKRAIEVALNSRLISEVFLSSNDFEIITEAESCGLKNNYVRPEVLATDEALIIDVVLHAINWLEVKGKKFDAIMVLQPTSPLRSAEMLDEAITQFSNSGADSLISVNEVIEHPYECMKLIGNTWKFLERNPSRVSRRQDYVSKYFFVNGLIYLTKIEFIRQKNLLYEEGSSQLFYTKQELFIDIDYPWQLEFAKVLMDSNKKL
jgi:CMP-N,N'-diacetyllegionaminic acid synthase